MRYKNLTIEKIFHAAVVVKDKVTIYFDPLNLPPDLKHADLILVTHEHFDHCSAEDIKKIADGNTIIVATEMCRERLKGIDAKETKYVKPGDKFNIGEIKIEVVPAYNIDKFRSPGVPFHPREQGKAGYVVEIDGVRIYHAGDTDNIPEMHDLHNIDVALLPVSGQFVMTPKEASEAVKVINPKVVIPIHCGDYQGIGTGEDVEEFRRLCQSLMVEIK